MTSEAVRVIVRCRPFNAREKQLKSKNIIEINTSTLQCSISNGQDANIPPKTFTFDGVYDQSSTTEQIYTDFVYSLVEGVIEGYNATVFAYGQTGSGKSFTMQGVPSPSTQNGILPRTFEHLFESMAASQGVKYLVFASYLEIYNEEIRDLLSSDIKRKLELREEQGDRGVYVAQLSQHPVHSVEDCHRLMENGWKNRAVGATLMNADSSRSHSIFSISLERMEVLNGTGSTRAIRCGKLNLVDLAGSERQSKTGASGDRLKEATKINLSLSALGNVISALVDGKSKHIPYRDSKLTRLLQDSLGGNTKTLMISCISPADDNYDETLSTLRYANRAKNIQNRPRINQDPQEAMLKEYQMEIERLRQLLDKSGQPPADVEAETMRLERERQLLKAEYEEKIQNLQRDIEKEQETNAKAAVEMENLRRHYQDELQKISQNVPPAPDAVNGTVVDDQAEEKLKKLKEIEENLVGGERADDKEFQERRLNKKTQVERRMALLAQLLAKTRDEDGSLLRVYDDIQQEIRVKSEVIKKYKSKLRSLDREIQDLHSEFQSERVDYLETIRRQDQQLRLLQQVLGKVQLIIRKDCNYSDMENVMRNSIWSDEFQRWKLPEVTFLRTRLPPAGTNGMLQNNYETVVENAEESNGDRLLQKLERGEAEDLAGRYFRPSRAKQIINKSHQDVHRAIQLTKQAKMAPLSQSHTALNHLKGPVNGSESNNSLHVSTSLPTSWSAPNSFNNNVNGWTGGNTATNGPAMMRKPKRLESLTVATASTDGQKVSASNDIKITDVT